ncbi:hypothetical protein ILYODFUR_015797 [Ilyodon furcidens]|uniref:Uncharacterized protein n=1 Tax=Ilyodon furcidens TaxID=33524 RepID=A0ABV0TYM9_9TELE
MLNQKQPYTPIFTQSIGLSLFHRLPTQILLQETVSQHQGSFEIESVFSSPAACLKLISHLHVDRTLNDSQVRPILSSLLCPPAEHLLPTQVIDEHIVFTVCRILDVWSPLSVFLS